MGEKSSVRNRQREKQREREKSSCDSITESGRRKRRGGGRGRRVGIGGEKNPVFGISRSHRENDEGAADR